MEAPDILYSKALLPVQFVQELICEIIQQFRLYPINFILPIDIQKIF